MNKEQAMEVLKTELTSGHPDFFEMTMDELALHNAKNADYSKGGDPLGNFYRVSAALTDMGFKISPTMVAIVYAFKQLDAAIHMLTEGYEGDIENVDTRLRDVHVYMKLARILHKESKKPEGSVPQDGRHHWFVTKTPTGADFGWE